ncbi:MAG TPA: ABC transporter permease [Geminicoccaceae bacterium]|nr:ABC transporter permease [Geminicoccaceae bacterium]
MDFALIQFLNGLASASSLFLVAAGLSLIFGVTRIVNFAHGSFYMLGAYLAVTLTGWLGGAASPRGFWGGLLLAATAVGVLGGLVELLLLRRIYRSPELFQLLATFGVVLVVGQVVILVWGPVELIGPRSPGLAGAVTVLGRRFPEYELALIALGPLVLLLLLALLKLTRWGVLVRAATQDREMVGALGVNQAWLFTSVFALGAFLAALGGALQLPRDAVTHDMDLRIIADAFVIVVVGGMGSVTGAFLAALLIGELTAFGIWLMPQITLVLPFLVMAVVLVVRPYGLLGRPEIAGHGAATVAEPVLRPASTLARSIGGAVVLGLLLLPLVAGAYVQYLMVEILCLALFAASLHFMMGPGGMVSFGHAAYFGLGAYGAALLVKYLAAPMEAALVVAVATAFAGALLFGWFCVRLAGVYLAMLSLAFAQITYAVAFQWYEFTGGDNGIFGIWPSAWASPTTVYYYFALALNVLALLLLRRIIYAPFGYTLRACRDSPLRADAIGIDVRNHRWLGFTLAGTFAGLAGGVLAFLKGSIDTTWLAIPQSIKVLVMVLLGGVQTLVGPLVGAAGYHALEIWMSALTNLWPLFLGALIIVICVAFPQGLVGFAQARLRAGET